MFFQDLRVLRTSNQTVSWLSAQVSQPIDFACTFQVEIDDWFDSSNLADHTSMILQAMMSDVFNSPTNSAASPG